MILLIFEHHIFGNTEGCAFALAKSPSTVSYSAATSTVRGSRVSRNYKAYKYHIQKKFDIVTACLFGGWDIKFVAAFAVALLCCQPIATTPCGCCEYELSSN